MADNKVRARNITADLAHQFAETFLPASPRPIAATRITRTPILQTSGESWPEDKAAEYNPATGNITVRALDAGQARTDIPHESAHALFNQAGLSSQSANLSGQVPADAMRMINYFPQIYRPQQSDAPAESQRYREMVANEGLGYSIGNPDATPYVEAAANKMQNPHAAAQLLRLHRNAIANNSTGNLLRSPLVP